MLFDMNYTVTGTLSNNNTVLLDKPLQLESKRIRMTIEVLPEQPDTDSTFMQLIADIHQTLEQSGHVPPSKEEVDDRLNRERASWDF